MRILISRGVDVKLLNVALADLDDHNFSDTCGSRNLDSPVFVYGMDPTTLQWLSLYEISKVQRAAMNE